MRRGGRVRVMTLGQPNSRHEILMAPSVALHHPEPGESVTAAFRANRLPKSV